MLAKPRPALVAIPRLASAIALTIVLAAASGGGDDGGNNGNDGSGVHPDPAPTLYAVVDAINRGDIQSFYNGLSADRRASTTAADVQRALDTVQLILGYVPKLEITQTGEKRINGDSADVEMINSRVGKFNARVQTLDGRRFAAINARTINEATGLVSEDSLQTKKAIAA